MTVSEDPHHSADADRLIGRVAEKAAADADRPPAAPVGADELAGAERELGFGLPPLLARLYREVGNGGFGPEYRLYPLVGEEPSAVRVYLRERAAPEGAGGRRWPEGVLPILTWGGGMYAAVDCRSEEATVLLFLPDGVEDEDFGGAWHVDAGSLAAWLETWLTDAGWYREDHDDATGTAWVPPRWPLAAARL